MSCGVGVVLRVVEPADLPIFFEHERDPEARWMAAFVGEDGEDRAVFDAHWAKILAEPTVCVRTIMAAGEVAGSIAAFDREGDREVTYWLGRDFWGRGIATAALRLFLEVETRRPIWGRVVRDNAPSRRVLRKCGFVVVGRDRGHAEARGGEVEEVILRLD